jgi:hypothetical protein
VNVHDPWEGERPPRDRLTSEVKPFAGVTETANVTPPPGSVLAEAGEAETLKSGCDPSQL